MGSNMPWHDDIDRLSLHDGMLTCSLDLLLDDLLLPGDDLIL